MLPATKALLREVAERYGTTPAQSNGSKKKNGMNGADSVTTTEWSAGSSSTSRTYNRK